MQRPRMKAMLNRMLGSDSGGGLPISYGIFEQIGLVCFGYFTPVVILLSSEADIFKHTQKTPLNLYADVFILAPPWNRYWVKSS